MAVQRRVTLRQGLNVVEEHLNQETGVLKSGMMAWIMVIMNVIREILTMLMVVISSDELNLDGTVMMEDLGLQMFVGIGAEMEEDCQLKNAMITI